MVVDVPQHYGIGLFEEVSFADALQCMDIFENLDEFMAQESRRAPESGWQDERSRVQRVSLPDKLRKSGMVEDPT